MMLQQSLYRVYLRLQTSIEKSLYIRKHFSIQNLSDFTRSDVLVYKKDPETNLTADRVGRTVL